MEKYAFTLKCNWTDYDDDREMLAHMVHSNYKKYTILCYYFEDQDKHGRRTRLHVHGVIEAPPKLYYRQFCRKGWHIHHKRMYSDAWLLYCKKQSDRRDKEAMDYYRKNYAFDD